MQVDTSVAEADVGQAAGRAWRRPSRSTPSPRERFKGKVRQIRNAPQTVQNVVTYDAVIDVDNPELKLKPGHDRQRDLRLRRAATDVLRVPNAALRFRPPAGAWRRAPAPRRRRRGGQARRRATGSRRARRARPQGDAAGSRRRTVWVLRGGEPHAGADPDRASPTARITEVVEGELQRGRPGDHRRQPATPASGDAAPAARRARRPCGACSEDGDAGRRPLIAARGRRPRSTAWATSRCTRCAASRLQRRARASSSPSWARRARASRR